jgi:hypothetical protein
MKITLTDESTGQEIVPLDCDLVEDDKQNTIMTIKNQNLIDYIIKDLALGKKIKICHSEMMLYFLYDNKKYLTDDYSTIVDNVKKNGKKSYYITFKNNNGEILKQFLSYDI